MAGVKLTAEEAITYYNERYLVVKYKGKALLLPKNFADNPEFVAEPVATVRTFDADYFVRKEDKKMTAVDFWLESGTAVKCDGITFAPGSPLEKPAKYERIPGKIVRDPQKLNLWSGWRLEPRKGSCQRFLDHIYEIACNGDESLYRYFLCWLGALVQRPAERPGVAIVLRGGRGTGKGTIANTIGKLFKPLNFAHITTERLASGDFGGHFLFKVFIFFDEAFYAGNKSAESFLKAIITEDTLTVDVKFLPPVTIKNCTWLMLASNDSWIVPAGIDERRFFVLDLSTAHQQDISYFRKIHDELKNGGLEALLHHLLFEVDPDEVELRRPPTTAALIEQKIESASTVVRFWHNALNEGDIFSVAQEQGFLFKDDVFNDYKSSDWLKARFRESPTNFWKETRKIFPSVREGGKKYRVKGGKRLRTVLLPSLAEARVQFEKFLKGVY